MKRGGTNTAARARNTRRKPSSNSQAQGFTIVEVLIVLAVTGAMFVWAALLISGRQAKTEFQVGIRDVQTKLQQSINEVKSGYYPFNTGFRCDASGTAPLDIDTGGIGFGQGEHNQCTFIGKTVAISNDTMYVYSMAGARLNATGGEVQSPLQSNATVIGPATGPPPVNSSAPDLTTTMKLPSGITLVGAGQNGALNPTPIYAVAILSSFNSIVTSTTASSGMQTFALYGFDMSNFPANPSKGQIANAINEETSYPPLQNVKFCLKSGTTDESVIITIGDISAQGTSVSSVYRNGPSC